MLTKLWPMNMKFEKAANVLGCHRPVFWAGLTEPSVHIKSLKRAEYFDMIFKHT